MNCGSRMVVKGVTGLVLVISLAKLVRSLSGVSESNHNTWINHGAINSFSVLKNSPRISSYDSFKYLFYNNTQKCHMDRSQPPSLEKLVKCRDSAMFHVWRPKARLMGPSGWMNDPMGIFETKNGSFHIGYQCSPNHLGWANISQCSASTTDFVHFTDYNSWKDPVTLAPTQVYDIAGVFDGVVIKDGWNGYPSILYTSVFMGNFAPQSEPPEVEGVETQSIAYTKDDGSTWTKLDFGANGNPAIYYWPEKNLSGFRDPFVFESQEFSDFYTNTSLLHQLPGDSKGRKPTGDKYLLISGGIRKKADPINGGPRLFLYRQNENKNIRDWTYLGSILSFPAEYGPKSEWTGGNGINFECGSFSKIDEQGLVNQADSSPSSTQLNIFTVGTEGARNSTHMDDWPVWYAVSWDYNSPDGNVKGNVEFSGVIDWGRAYAFTQFPKHERQLMVGWTYEDDEFNVLTHQRGSQGAFTLFREMFVKVINNVHPSSLSAPEHYPSWKTRKEPDGSDSIITLGQRILPEITSAFRNSSEVTKLKDFNLKLSSNQTHYPKTIPTNLVEFEQQPNDRYYAISAQLDFFLQTNNTLYNPSLDRSSTLRGGFRILASDHEWTDIYYDPKTEYLVIDRSHSSKISCYGNSTETAKHRLWPILNPTTNQTKYETLNLTIIVDNSVLEVHANEGTIITTRVYPWYGDSINVKYFVQGLDPKDENLENRSAELNDKFQPSVQFSNVELWDGLLNAWPDRPYDTSIPFVHSNNMTRDIYGVWPDL